MEATNPLICYVIFSISYELIRRF